MSPKRPKRGDYVRVVQDGGSTVDGRCAIPKISHRVLVVRQETSLSAEGKAKPAAERRITDLEESSTYFLVPAAVVTIVTAAEVDETARSTSLGSPDWGRKVALRMAAGKSLEGLT